MIYGKTLILSPHMDDEVLGCGGIVAKMMEAYPNLEDKLSIFYFNDFHPGVDTKVFLNENLNFMQMVRCTKTLSRYKLVNRLSTFEISRHITEIEEAINVFEPDTLFIPFPSYNQDHRHVFESAITASRPHDKNFYVKNVLVYEQPETLHTNRCAPHFVPHVFVPININKKIELYQIYKSQIRGHRKVSHIRHLAAVRGMSCCVPYAEAFMVIRSTL